MCSASTTLPPFAEAFKHLDWEALRARTDGSPYASAFLTMVEELGVAPRAERDEAPKAKPRIRLA